MTDLDLITLLAVRLRSRGPLSAVTATVGDLLDDAAPARSREIGAIVERMIDRGQVRQRGDEHRLSLTPSGEAELAARLAADIAGPDRAEATTAYEAFLPVNRRFLVACVSWQANPDDVSVLAELVNELGPIVAALSRIRYRFASYPARMAAALSQADDDRRWIDSPTLDSVHTAWFELHEHLLATLGRERADER